MNDSLVIGTVRAIRNNRYVVVLRGGAVVDVVFDGEATPKIGGDVIGVLRRDGDGTHRMSLRKSIAEVLINGRSNIAFAGFRHDMTARLLAKILAKSKSAAISPGNGVSIDRSPLSNDADLNWAMAIFGEEADRLGIALNVIDVDAVSKAPWRGSSLGDSILPADADGRGRVMSDLTKLLRSGFHPACNRMIENISGENEISVNFVLPYSPYSGRFGFCRELSGMNRRFVPAVGGMTLSDSRRLSAARHLALGLAHARLGVGAVSYFDASQSRRAKHMANCFADAAAVLAFLSSGGDPSVAELYADLRESSLYFGRATGVGALHPGVLEEATHRSIRQAMKREVVARATTPKAIATEAVRIARRTAMPAVRFRYESDFVPDDELASASAIARRVVRDVSNEDVARDVATSYRNEIRTLVRAHSVSDLSSFRLVTFGGMHSPLHLSRIFDEETADIPRMTVNGTATKAKTHGLRRGTVASVREDAPLEFDIPLAP